MLGIKTSVKLGRIEFTFYPDLLELAQSSDYPVIKAQTFTQETYHGHQLFHIGKITFDKIHKLEQFAVLLFISVFYLLYLFGLLLFPLSGFLFKFKYAVLQILVPAFQRFLLSTSEKRTHTFGYVGRCGSGCAFQFLGLYFFLARLSSCSASAFCSCNLLFSISRASFFFFISRFSLRFTLFRFVTVTTLMLR